MHNYNCYQAGWQSGYAAACKAVDSGSIPDPASIYKWRRQLAKSCYEKFNREKPNSHSIR